MAWRMLLVFLLGTAQEPLPRVPPGWTIEVVARAPTVRHPSVVCCAPDGRVFVGEDPMDISAPADARLGRVLCLHPDGRWSVVAEGLHAPFGMMYLDGRLWVHHAPRLSVFTEDGARTDLIECTNPNPWAFDWNDHVPANLRPAMDGFLYMSVGDKGIYGAVGRDGRAAELHGGGILRLRPDGTGLEVYTTGTRNHLDVAINAEDELFTYDNTDEKNDWWTRVTHMVEGGYHGYPYEYKPPRPWTLPAMTEYGGGAPTAGFAYEEDALPPEYRGNLILADFGKRLIHSLRLERAGATYRVAAREDLTPDPPPDFRPVGLALAPDGVTFYIGDWNHRDVKADVVAGRLLRLRWTGPSHAAPKPAWWLPAATGRPFEATSAELAAALRHPAHGVRLVAQRRLSDRREVEPLAALLADRGAPAQARVHALWALDAIDGGERARAAIAAAVSDPAVRLQAVRQIGTRRVAAAEPMLSDLLKDADPAMRFRAATALGRIGRATSVEPLLEALGDPDRFARFAVWTALNRIGRADPSAWRPIAAALGAADAAVRQGARFAMREMYEPRLVEALAAMPPTADALELLSELCRRRPAWKGEWWAYHPLSSPPPPKDRAWEGTAAALAALRGALGAADPALRAAAARALGAAADRESAGQLRARFDAESDPAARRAMLSALLSMQDDRALAASVLARPGEAPELLVEAAEAAGRMGAADVLIAFLRRGPAPPEAEVAAIAGVGRSAEATELLTARLADARPEVARAAIGALAGRPEAVGALLEAFGRAPTRLEAAAALARRPDVRALDAYLYGLETPVLAEGARAAIEAIAAEARRPIERQVRAGRVAPRVVAELQSIYARWKALERWRGLGPMPMRGAPRVDPTADGGALKTDGWVELRGGKGGFVNLGGVLSPDREASALVHATLESAVERTAELRIGSDDGVVLWVNGARIYGKDVARGWNPDDDRVRVTLRAGANHLTLRVLERGGGSGFSVRVAEPGTGPIFEAAAERAEPEAYLEFAATHAGDAARGREVFRDERIGCVKCHRVGGEGGQVGPELSTVGTQFGRRELAESVLFPSRAIREGYRSVTLVLEEESVSGVLAAETPDEVTVVEASGLRRRIRKADVRDRRASALSAMPEGLQAAMSPQAFADLVSYLESLR